MVGDGVNDGPASPQANLGFVLSPEIAALSMTGSSFLVAVSALLLKRLRLPRPEKPGATTAHADRSLVPAGNR